MLRDSANMDKKRHFCGLQANWHIVQSSNPNVSLCLIEKIGCKQWMRIFTALNEGDKASSKDNFWSEGTHTITLPSSSFPSCVV
jgi:hypothetical protein